jgi:hypothetical protein
MDDLDHCWERLQNLADHAQQNLRGEATRIIGSFTAQANQGDIDRLKQRVQDELAAETAAQVPLSALERHSRWLALLNAAKRALG